MCGNFNNVQNLLFSYIFQFIADVLLNCKLSGINWFKRLHFFFRVFSVSNRGGSGTSTVQLSHGNAKEPRDPHPGRQKVHGHREHWWTAKSLPGCHIETRNDASIQLRSAAGLVRRPPQWHGETPVLPRLRLFLQGGKYKSDHFNLSDSLIMCFVYLLRILFLLSSYIQ